jgi:hypothetical protein
MIRFAKADSYIERLDKCRRSTAVPHANRYFEWLVSHETGWNVKCGNAHEGALALNKSPRLYCSRAKKQGGEQGNEAIELLDRTEFAEPPYWSQTKLCGCFADVPQVGGETALVWRSFAAVLHPAGGLVRRACFLWLAFFLFARFLFRLG